MKTYSLLLSLITIVSFGVSAQNTFPTTGNVGVGTTAPVNKLEIRDYTTIPALGIRGNLDSKLIFEPSDGSDRFSIWADMDPTTWNDLLKFSAANATNILVLKGDGNVGIGTITPDYKLTVNGKVKCEELQVVVDVPADYVFHSGYDLMPLSAVSDYIAQHKHLPNIPSAEELQKQGWNVGEMSNKLLEKIEELTLYSIQLKSENEELKARLEKLEQLILEK